MKEVTMPTIFERIIAGEIPSNKLYEDDKMIIIMDIHPVQKGHVLLIPKKVSTWLDECDDETVIHLMLMAKKMMKHMKSVLTCDYVHLVVEGVEVPHVHIHLIPSMLPVKNAEWHHVTYDEGEMDIYKEKLQLDI